MDSYLVRYGQSNSQVVLHTHLLGDEVRVRMGVFTATFAADRRAMSEVLHLLPETPDLLTKRYYQMSDTAHPLGVGWNKVESVRGWLRASGLISPSPRSQTGEWQLTPLGELVARFDPNLSKQVTWWYIHMGLVTNPDATVYHNLFSYCARQPFTRAEAGAAIASRAARDLKPASVDSDIAGILSSFEPGRTKLAALGVLTTDGERWMHGTPEGITLALVAYAVCIVRERNNLAAPSMALQSLTSVPGGLWSIFGLGVDALRAPLRQLVGPLATYGYTFTETADLDSVTFGSLDSSSLVHYGYEGELRDEISI